jgi:tetratricopeptide (TPR) repeat protein
MHASLLCGRYEEALAIFAELNEGELAAASEWHWEGAYYRAHPACRDIAMRALGAVRPMNDTDDNCEHALKLYQQAREDQAKISIEALCGVVDACALAGRWEEAVELFLTVLDRNPEDWLVLGDDMQISLCESESIYSRETLVAELGVLLERVMRTCNTFKRFGVALLCMRLFDVSLAAPYMMSFEELLIGQTEIINNETKEEKQHTRLVQAILPTICCSVKPKDLHAATIVSLCGVNLPQEACSFFEIYASRPGIREDQKVTRNNFDLYEYADQLREQSDTSIEAAWTSAYRHIHRITACLANIENQNETLSLQESKMISSVLASAIRDCSVASSAAAGLVLGRWAERRRLQTDVQAQRLFNLLDQNMNSPILVTDSLLSAAIEAYRLSGRLEESSYLLQSNLRNDVSPSEWLLSYHEAVKALFAQGETENALALFRNVIASGRNPGLFCTAAQSLKIAGDWRGVLDIYRLALSSGCASEELSFLAMESVAASGRIGQKGQLPLLRSIIGETAKAAGVTPAVWLESNYFALRRELGFSTARLIMGWDDYKTSRLDELELAVEILEKRAVGGLTPKHGVLHIIVAAAAKFVDYEVPSNRTGLPKIPRDRNMWVRLFEKAMSEAKKTKLMTQPRFINEAAIAYNRLGCYEDCVRFVNSAIARGLNLPKAALMSAHEAAKKGGIETRASDINLLIDDMVTGSEAAG